MYSFGDLSEAEVDVMFGQLQLVGVMPLAPMYGNYDAIAAGNATVDQVCVCAHARVGGLDALCSLVLL
jgi:hypothetical protein